jgi:hypothetical protein
MHIVLIITIEYDTHDPPHCVRSAVGFLIPLCIFNQVVFEFMKVLEDYKRFCSRTTVARTRQGKSKIVRRGVVRVFLLLSFTNIGKIFIHMHTWD